MMIHERFEVRGTSIHCPFDTIVNDSTTKDDFTCFAVQIRTGSEPDLMNTDSHSPFMRSPASSDIEELEGQRI
jgi:hypothetical protein